MKLEQVPISPGVIATKQKWTEMTTMPYFSTSAPQKGEPKKKEKENVITKLNVNTKQQIFAKHRILPIPNKKEKEPLLSVIQTNNRLPPSSNPTL